MKLIRFIINLFKSNKPKRKRLKDVKVGERIRIEWDRIKSGTGHLECIGNDPKKKTIFLQIKWGNYKEVKEEEYQKIVLNYDSKELKNFNLLNQEQEEQEQSNESSIISLQKQLNQAIEKEDYEKAEKLKNDIDKLL